MRWLVGLALVLPCVAPAAASAQASGNGTSAVVRSAGSAPVRSAEISALLQQLDVARWRENEDEMRRLAEKFGEMAKENPKDAEAHFAGASAHNALLNLYVLRDKKDRARQELERALERVNFSISLDGQRAESFALRAELHGWRVGLANPIARPFSAMSNGGKIKENLARALELAPQNPGVHISAGMEDYYKPPAAGGDLNRAAEHFHKAIQLDSKSIDAWMWFGLTRLKQKKNADARTAFEKVLELDPHNVRAARELAALK